MVTNADNKTQMDNEIDQGDIFFFFEGIEWAICHLPPNTMTTLMFFKGEELPNFVKRKLISLTTDIQTIKVGVLV
ncbi:hypothetical protein RUM44_010626 [Polyplax serrata]|uniref:Uncharacterized protein n=1 Tax=Polyplax serrata TaxID=468196 RepID=A0ABR1AMR4_POLSC